MKTIILLITVCCLFIFSAVSSTIEASSLFINKTLFFNKNTNKLFFEDSFNISQQTTNNINFTKPVCEIFLNYSRNISGWNVLTVTPDKNLLFNEDPYKAYYYSGYSEGYWNYEDILNMQYNSNPYPLDSSTQKWFEVHVEFLKNLPNNKKMIEENPTLVYGAIRFYNFIQGLTDGLNKMIDEQNSMNNGNNNKIQNWNFIEMLVQSTLGGLPDIQMSAKNMFGNLKEESSSFFVSHDFEDYEKLFVESHSKFKKNLFSGNNQNDYEIAYFQKHLGTHCSAMCKLTENEIYLTHSTWILFPYLLKVFKTYNFETSVSMSSFPGSISSLDDFYFTPRFSVLETSLVQMNSTLTKLYVKPEGGFLECFRVMIANIWAKDGDDWSKLFLTQTKNSSAPGENPVYFAQIMDYSNQYMVLDNTKPYTNATTNRLEVPQGTFHLVEQLGPYSEYADWSSKLAQDTYIPGFNFAFFPKIKQLTGLTHLEQKYGSMFSDKLYARAQIFARNQSDVKTVVDLQNLMRWNRAIATEESKIGQLDPLSEIPNCDGCNPKTNPQLTIASRGDLCPFPGTQTFVYNGQNVSFGNLSETPVENFLFPYVGGEIDNKIIAWSSFQKDNLDQHDGGVKSWIVAGPTTSNDFLPHFSWDTLQPSFSPTPRHRGIPPLFNFTYMNVFPKLLNQNGTSPGVIPWNPPSNNNNHQGSSDDDKMYRIEIAIGAGLGGSIILILTVVFAYTLISKKHGKHNSSKQNFSTNSASRDRSEVQYHQHSTNNKKSSSNNYGTLV